MENWRKTNSFAYVVRATDSVHGVALDELRKRYFAVGVADNLVEIPFTDVLVVFSMIEQELAALKAIKGPIPPKFSVKFTLTTDFSDEEAVRLLSQIQIETPFDEGKRMRIASVRRPADDGGVASDQ